MAVAITDLRTTINQFDTSDNNLDGSTGGNNSRDVFTVDPDPIEGTASIGVQISDGAASAETVVANMPAANTDLTNQLIYGWFQVPNVDTVANVGVGMTVGDGTNVLAYGVAGGDQAGFRHDQNLVEWNCVVLDTSLAENNGTTVSYSTTTNGALTTGVGENTTATPNFASVDRVGYFCQRVVPIKGNTANSFFDILRHGNDGIRITASDLSNSTFFDLAEADRSGADGAGYGICRQVGANEYALQGSITFGPTGAVITGLVFVSTNETIFFQDIPTAPVGTVTVTSAVTTTVPRMRFISSSSTNISSTTNIRFGTRTGQGTGNNGCTLLATLEADIDFTDNGVDSIGIYGSVLRDWFQIQFATGGNATSHEVFQTDFIGCGQISVNDIEFRANGIFNSTATGTDTAAVKFIDTTDTSLVTDLFFSSGGTGHAIEIDTATNGQTFIFTNYTFTGYATTNGGTGNEAILNTSGQPITIEVAGGSGVVSVDTTNSNGAVTIVNNITVAITGIHGASEVKVLENPSPYTATSLPAPAINPLASTERVSADIIEGDGTNYFQYTNNNGKVRLNAIGTAAFSGVLSDGDTAGTSLTDGDEVCVFIRDDDDNPTLQLEDDGFVIASTGTGQAAPSASTIDTDTDFATFESVFGTTLFSANSKMVSVERKNARYEFNVPNNTVIDFLVFKIGDQPILTTEQTITNDNKNFPISQVGDRNYLDPA